MRASTKGFNKHHGDFRWHSVDELVLQIQGGIALPKPALAGDISSTERFISQASGALAEFAKESGERRAEIVECGAVPALVNILKTMGEIPRSLAALALAELVADGGAATVHPIADAGAIPPLVAIIRQGAAANIGQGVEQGRQASSGFSAAEVWAMADVRAAFYIDERGMRKTMADAMPRPVTIERCARALRGLALVPRAASAIGRCGAVKPLLQLMQRADSRVTRAACGNCLVSLSAEPDFRDAMGSVGVLTPFMAMLQPMISRDRAARSATLGKAKDGEGEGEGEVVDVNDPLRGGRGELDAKERLELERKGGALMASCAVRNLLFNPSNKNLFVDQGGIELLVGLLRQGQTRVAEKATSALIHLARSRGHREAMVRAGTIAAVQLHLDADLRKLRHAAFELIGMLGFAVQVHEMLDIMHPLMLMLSSSFASERILAAGVLGNLLRTDEHKVVAAQGCVLNPGIGARDRRRVKEWKRKKARKQSKARLAAILRKYRISRADAEERDQVAKWRPDYLMQMVFSEVERDALLTQFVLLDSTRSGTIDANDVGEILTILGKAPRGRRKLAAFRSRVAALVDECDTDGLGMVPFNGLLRVIYIWDSRYCSALRKCVRALPSLPGASQRAMRRRQQAAEEQAAKIQKEVEEQKKREASRASGGSGLNGSDAADGATEDEIKANERWNGRGLLARWGASDARRKIDCRCLQSGKQPAVRGELVISRPPLRFLHVRVHSCSDLACTESAGRNDVYCEVQWGGRERRVLGRTATVEDTLDPEWDGVSVPQACFRSQLPDSLGGFQLRVSVWDDDLGKAEFLGQLVIDAQKFMRPQLRPVSMKLEKIAGASRRRNRFVSGQIALSWRTEEPTGEGIIGLVPPSLEDFDSTVNLGMPEAATDGATDQSGQKSSKSSNEDEPLPPGHARAREADAAGGLAPGTVIVTVPKRARPMQRIVVHLPGTSGRVAEAVIPEGKVEGMTFEWLPPKEVKRAPQYASALEVRKVARRRLHRFALQISAARFLAYGGRGYAETLLAMGGAAAAQPPEAHGRAKQKAAKTEPQPRLYVEVRASTVENFDDDDESNDLESRSQAAKAGGNARLEELDPQAAEVRETEMLCETQLVSMLSIGQSDPNDKLDGAPGTGTRAPSDPDRPTAISWDDVVFECRMPHDMLRNGEICITLYDANMPKSRTMLGQVRLRGVELLRLSRDPCAHQLANRLGDVPPAEDTRAPARRLAGPRVVPTAGATEDVDAGGDDDTMGQGTSANDTVEAGRAIAARVAAQAKRDRERRERQERHARRRREIARAEAKLNGEAAQREKVERTAAAVTKHWRARLARWHTLELLGEVYAHIVLPNGASAYAGRDPPHNLRYDMPIPSLQRSCDLPVEKMPGEQQDSDIIEDAEGTAVAQEGDADAIKDGIANETALVQVPRPPSSAPPAHVLQLEQGRQSVQSPAGSSPLHRASTALPARPDFKMLLESDLFEAFNTRDMDFFYDIFLKTAATSAGNSAARSSAPEKRDWRTSGGTMAENPMKLAMSEMGVAAEIEEVECLGLVNGLVQSSDLAPYTARHLRTMLSDIDADAIGFVCFEHFLRLINVRRIERRSKRLKREKEAATREARRRARLLEPPSDTDDEDDVEVAAAGKAAFSASGTANGNASKKASSKTKSKAKAKANTAKGSKWYVAPIVAQHFTAEEVEEMRREFIAFDEDGSGAIDEQELKELMRAQGDHTITSAQVHQMMMRADEDGSGTIDFNEFVGMVKKRLLEDDVDADDESDDYEYISEYTVEVDGNEEEYEMPRLLKRDFTRKQIVEYREKFRERDPHRTGEVSAHDLFELVNEIAPAGLPVNEDEFTELVCQADSDHTGALNFGQFMQMMKDVDAAMGSATRLGQLLGKNGRGALRRCLACECCGAGPRPDPEELLVAEPRSQYRAERIASRQRELREQLEYDDNGSVTLLVDMLRSSIEMAKENALATLLELVLHDKCADLVMRAGGIQPLVDLKRNSRNEVEEELAAQVLDTVSKLRYDWHNTVVDAELTEKERARMKERLDPYYLPAEIKMDFDEDDIEQLKALFMHVDEDNAKHIDAQETTTVLRCLGWNSSYDHIEYMINEVDLDRSGTIDFKELAHLVLELREQHYNRPAAKIGRCLLMFAKLPVVLAIKCARSTVTFVMEDDAELTRVELINDVRRRIDRGEESWDEIMNSLSEADQQAVRDEGLSKWS